MQNRQTLEHRHDIALDRQFPETGQGKIGAGFTDRWQTSRSGGVFDGNFPKTRRADENLNVRILRHIADGCS